MDAASPAKPARLFYKTLPVHPELHHLLMLKAAEKTVETQKSVHLYRLAEEILGKAVGWPKVESGENSSAQAA